MNTIKRHPNLLKGIICFLTVIVFFAGCYAYEFTGPVGPQGERGEKGEKGDQGDDVVVRPKPKPPIDPVDPGPEVDPFTPIAVTGERYEKYYLVPLTPTEEEYFDFVSPRTIGANSGSTLAPILANLGYGSTNSYDAIGSLGHNQLSLYDIPLTNLMTKTPMQIRASGTIAVAGLHASFFYAYYYLCGSAVFDTTITVSNINHNPVGSNVYDVHDPFTGALDNLVLPKTDDFASSDTIYRGVVFSVSVPASTLESICPGTFTISSACSLQVERGHMGMTNPHLCGYGAPMPASYKFPVSQTLEIPATIPHAAESRNFYQYSTLTVRYPKEASLLEITPSSIVESYTYDETTNTITVTFTEYDTPYVGDVLSYTIMSDEKQEDKVITIAE